jgi:prolyl oligopeptidase
MSMTPVFRRFAALALLNVCSLAAIAQQTPPPTSRTENFRESFHGRELIDPFHWLEDSESSETRKWIDAQNAYAHALLDNQPIRPEAAKRLTEMALHDHMSAPALRNGYYYFYRRGAKEDLWSYYRRKAEGGTDELLLNPHKFGPEGTSISVFNVSDDGARVAFGVRKGGQDETDLRIFDVNARRELPDGFAPALYRGFAFKKDGMSFYYTLESRESGQRILYHVIGTEPAKDAEVFKKGADTWVVPVVSEDGKYLLISAEYGWARGEVYVQNLDTRGPIQPLITGLNAKFETSFAGDALLVKTDWQAPKGRILRIDLRNPAQDKWREVVPARDDVIDQFTIFGGKLFVTYLHNVTSRISTFSLDGKPAGEVPLPGAGSAAISGRSDQDQGILFYTSYTTPHSLYRYDGATGKRALWYRDAVPFASENFETEQVWYPSKDGTRIPMFLIHRKGLKPDGNTPTILYGYGGFDVSITPDFGSSIAWWIEHGGLYAVANIRGGGEFGEEWHRSGMLARKQNVFDDFIAAAEWLIAKRYTNSSKLGIWGGSNGGLLVAAALTQHPELYQAVVCWHPDLDMVRYYKYTKNNNPPALLEYGNAADPDQFRFLYAYSPYEKVRSGTRYPAVLLESGDADTRVPPEQARKMTARLQTSTASDRPILLLYDAGGGHAGGETFQKEIENATYELTFMAWQLGMASKGGYVQ